MKNVKSINEFTNSQFTENQLNEKASWGVQVNEPYDEKAERKAANFIIKQDPITVVGASGQIDDDNTDVSVQFSNGDQIDYTYSFGGKVDIQITRNVDKNKYIDVSKYEDKYFGSTGTVIGDLCLIYHDFVKGKIK